MRRLHHLTADKREIKDFPKLPSATSFIRKPLDEIGKKKGGIKMLNKRSFHYISFLFVVAILSSCIPMVYYKWDISLQQPRPSDTLMYSDEFIEIIFTVGKTQIGFDMSNKTDRGIKINWDELSYISPTGRSMRVIHSGVRLIDRNAPQSPTIVPPTSRISDIIIPSEHIYYVSGKYGGWREQDLFYDVDKTKYEGKEFSVYMPLEIKGKRKEYTFTFRINKVTKVEK